MAPIFRRVRRTTTAELTADRYGSWMGAIYILFALCFFIINTGSMLKGAGKVISQATGGNIPVNEIVVAMTALFILYSFVGGLVAAAWTDLFQGVLIIVLSFMLIPLGWGVVGGLSGMKASLEPFRFSLATPSGITPWVIAMLTINGLVGIMAQPQMMATVGTGRTERTCRIGMLFGNMVKRVCTVGWALVGLIVAAMVAQGRTNGLPLTDPEDAFGFACRQLLFPGALGLLIASVLAANMSACSAFLVDAGALFTEGLYRRVLVKDREDRHYLWIGRVSGFIITMKEACQPHSELADKVQGLERVAEQIDRDVDYLVWELRPTALDDLGLQAALSNYVSEWSSRVSIAAELHASGLTERLPSEIETTLYRIAQEAMTNVARHARATRVDVLLQRQQDHVILVVEDDGVGFEPGQPPKATHGFGLKGMRERASLVGATIEIESAPGRGTTILVRSAATPRPHGDA